MVTSYDFLPVNADVVALPPVPPAHPEEPEGVHGLREELVERGVAHAVHRRPLHAGPPDGRVALLRHHRLARLTVDVGEAERGISGKLVMIILIMCEKLEIEDFSCLQIVHSLPEKLT